VLGTFDNGGAVHAQLLQEIGTPCILAVDRTYYLAEAVTGFRHQQARIMSIPLENVRLQAFVAGTYPGLHATVVAAEAAPNTAVFTNNPTDLNAAQFTRGYLQSVRMMNKAAGLANEARALAVLWTKVGGQRPGQALAQGIARMFVTD
jgi:hypothetical protein